MTRRKYLRLPDTRPRSRPTRRVVARMEGGAEFVTSGHPNPAMRAFDGAAGSLTLPILAPPVAGLIARIRAWAVEAEAEQERNRPAGAIARIWEGRCLTCNATLNTVTLMDADPAGTCPACGTPPHWIRIGWVAPKGDA